MSSSTKNLLRITLTVGLITSIYAAFAAPHNGFDLTEALINPKDVLAGGPPKDGIPAIFNPKFITAKDPHNLQANDRILGIELDGISKAYPIGILNWHEIVNDEINNSHFAVTYCPLCGTGVAFFSEVQKNKLDFGVSGLLYNSDVLLYDRQTESLWSQILSTAISGDLKGEKLKRLPITHTSWSGWVKSHPDTLVLSEETGYSRDYQRNPYSGYRQSRTLYFQVNNKAPEIYHPKERVLGLEVGNQYKAYPFSEIDKVGKSKIQDEFAGQQFTINWDRKNQQASIINASGNPVPAIEGFWFAWFAFHPETLVFQTSE